MTEPSTGGAADHGRGDGTADHGRADGGTASDDGAAVGAPTDDRSGDPAPRRRHRRAVGGSGLTAADGPAVTGGAATGSSRDDTDLGWGQGPDPDDDERLRREVPPHW